MKKEVEQKKIDENVNRINEFLKQTNDFRGFLAMSFSKDKDVKALGKQKALYVLNDMKNKIEKL